MKLPSTGPNRSEPGDDAPAEDSESSPQPGRGPFAYLARMWRGAIPLPQIFWRDMVVIGTLVNLATMALALLAAAQGASTAAAIAIFLSPLPYNLLLVAAVWASADRQRSEWSWPARLGALLWLGFAFII